MLRLFNQYVSIRTAVLLPLDSALIAISFLLSARLAMWINPSNVVLNDMRQGFTWQTALSAGLLQVCFYYNDLYDLRLTPNRADLIIRLVQSVGAACLILGFLYFIIPALLIGQVILFPALALTLALSVGVRLAASRGLTQGQAKVLIFGTGEMAMTVYREISRREDLSLRVIGFVAEADSPKLETGTMLLGKPLIQSIQEVEALAEKEGVARIVVALKDNRGGLPVRSLVKVRMLGVQIQDAHSLVSSLTGRVWLDLVRPSWFVFSEGFRRSRFTIVWKRALDLAFAILGVAVSSPLMILTALIVWLDSGRPILYKQTRVGRGGRPFELLKFRSMRQDAEANGAQWAGKNDPRVTRIGAFLRKYRLDELPQFFNVIRGEMSFVGPRPERPVFVDELRTRISYYDERHLVRPGITGWAQISYAYGASVEDAKSKLEYDLFYLQNMSFMFDCAIILRTVRTVLFGSGAR